MIASQPGTAVTLTDVVVRDTESKALDDSAFFAANSIETEVFLLTISFHVHLIKPVSEGRIMAYGKDD